MAVRLNCGVWVVVPTWNIDVAIGMIREGVIEPWTACAVQRILKPGYTYVNVGANLGFYMAMGAKSVGRTGRVFAIEANPALLTYLMRSVYWSGYPDVIRLYNRAASDEDGRIITISFDAQFIGGASVALPRSQDASLMDNVSASLWEQSDATRFVQPDGQVTYTSGILVQRDCHTARLDTILKEEQRIDLLHMDIEGSEPAAIAGAQDVIKRSLGIAVIIEWSPHYCLAPELLMKTKNMWEFFESLGFFWYRIRHEDFKPSLPAPKLSPIESYAELLSTVHSDVLVVKNLRSHYAKWPRLIVKNRKPADTREQEAPEPKKWQYWMKRLLAFGRSKSSRARGSASD